MSPIMREFGAAAIWLATAGALMSGCDDKSAAIDACKLGQQEACERACDLGVGDEGGCMAAVAAGDLHLARVAHEALGRLLGSDGAADPVVNLETERTKRRCE